MSNSGANPFDDTAEPSWMAPPENTQSAAPAKGGDWNTAPSAAPAGSNYAPNAAVNPNANAKLWGITGPKMVQVLRVLHILCGLFIVFAAIWKFVSDSDLKDNTVIAALYTIFLGLILVLSELRMPKFDVVLRNNFGFLYGFKGKAAFLVFASIFPLSLGIVGIIAGVVAMAIAAFDVYIIFVHPYFKSAKSGADAAAYIPSSNV